MSTRFEILVETWWRPLLVPMGATADRSYLEITDDGNLRARLGWLFDHTFALADIESAQSRSVGFWWGIGWRTGFRGRIGLLGSHDGCVELQFREPQRVNMIIPLRCSQLIVSLTKPEEFLAALAAHRGTPATSA